MCGICGYFSDKSISDDELREMNDLMYHRGPDDSGIWQESSAYGKIGLAHRRLSVLDLSALGHQPMFSKDERAVIVYNGEIYNFKELRTELKQSGYTFESECDTEVILAAYQEWGYTCFQRFNGMFAVAIYERESGRLVLARDKMGKKPLYYYCNGTQFVFASELKPIMWFPYFKKVIRKSMVEKFLCSKYIEAPYTIFENTYKMCPGTYLVFQSGGLDIKEYWNVAEVKTSHMQAPLQFDEALEQMDVLLQDSVKMRLISDVPVGVFLSSGIDSALVAAISQKVADRQIKSFTIGFYDKERNEADRAARIAEYIGTQHKELYISENEILEMLKDLPYYYDEPFSDSSQLPTMLVSKMASEDITVALSGDGGDELYCGYKMYDWLYIAQRVDWAGRIAAHMPGSVYLKKNCPPEVRALLNNGSEAYKVQLFLDVMIEEADKLLGTCGTNIKYAKERFLCDKNWQERRMLLDLMTYLPDEVLAKTDRASMKYSLEVRCPLLDYRIVEQSFRIPHKYKYNYGRKKYILKKLANQYIPKELISGPKKGFGVPLKKWLRSVLKEDIKKYADQSILKKQDIFVPEAVAELMIKQEKSDKIMYSSMLWSFYVFQRWYQTYIEDLWSEKD